MSPAGCTAGSGNPPPNTIMSADPIRRSPWCAVSLNPTRALRRVSRSIGTLPRPALDVEIGDVERVLLDEVAARLDDIAHQSGEDLVGDVGVLDLDLQQDAVVRIERGFPELLGVH